jgi:hypothetical protein
MADNDEWLNDARARLARKEPRQRRPGSIAARVEALRPDIQAARDAGKGWLQIAANISDGEALNADAVRVAFSRSEKACRGTASRVAPPSTTERKSADPASEPMPTEPMPEPKPGVSTSEPDPIEVSNKPNMEDDTFLNMFGPMFDARDTRGRGREDGSSEEAQS